MSIQETSRSAFNEILPTLGERHREVLKFLATVENATNTEISSKLGIPINAITPRIHELRAKNLVEEAAERKCSVTSRKVKAWKTAAQTVSPQNRRCYKCSRDAVKVYADKFVCQDHSPVEGMF